MDLSYFYETDEAGTDVLRQRSVKTPAALVEAINNNMDSSGLLRFANGVAEYEQWEWFDNYQRYLVELAEATTYNLNLPVIYPNYLEMQDFSGSLNGQMQGIYCR